ncbi:hypothetical protein CBR_g6420 [Chara braunii]|uniref:Ig-like domain-containing protein n=1 Tax=Chara braunii TaxID=69332 RepID=A0A388KK01_CHABU|nr:hypothetical protein CBR_g6420 [Chara braunii]|eukprot:GBG70293.1 hypothetical protein CBR_g6420 [Chara braunii]
MHTGLHSTRRASNIESVVKVGRTERRTIPQMDGGAARSCPPAFPSTDVGPRRGPRKWQGGCKDKYCRRIYIIELGSRSAENVASGSQRRYGDGVGNGSGGGGAGAGGGRGEWKGSCTAHSPSYGARIAMGKKERVDPGRWEGRAMHLEPPTVADGVNDLTEREEESRRGVPADWEEGLFMLSFVIIQWTNQRNMTAISILNAAAAFHTRPWDYTTAPVTSISSNVSVVFYPSSSSSSVPEVGPFDIASLETHGRTRGLNKNDTFARPYVKGPVEVRGALETSSVVHLCKLDQGRWMECPTNINKTLMLYNVTSGSHTLFVRAADITGNVELNPTVYSFTVLPHGRMEVPCMYAVSYNGRPFTLQWNDTYTVTGANDTGSTPHNITVVAYNELNNSRRGQGYEATFSWFVDTTPPNTELISFETPGMSRAASEATVVFSSDEGVAGFQVTRPTIAGMTTQLCPDFVDDHTSPGYCNMTERFENLTVGSHSFKVAAFDAIGNVDPEPLTIHWSVKPIHTELEYTIMGTWVTFTVKAMRNDVVPFKFEYKLDDHKWILGPLSHTFTLNFTQGPHTIAVRAIGLDDDLPDPSPAVVSFIVDLTPPVTTITQAPSRITNQSPLIFTFNSTKEGLIEYRMDNNTYMVTTNKTIVVFEAVEGPHVFYVRVTDHFGNVGKPANYSFVLDFGPPETYIKSGPASPYLNSNSLLVLGASEPEVTYEYRIRGKGAEWKPLAKAEDVLYLPEMKREGIYSVEVRATDATGNVDPTPATFSWTVYLEDGLWSTLCEDAMVCKTEHIERVEYDAPSVDTEQYLPETRPMGSSSIGVEHAEQVPFASSRMLPPWGLGGY